LASQIEQSNGDSSPQQRRETIGRRVERNTARQLLPEWSREGATGVGAGRPASRRIIMNRSLGQNNELSDLRNAINRENAVRPQLIYIQ
jgi:hypothetical protein